MTEDTVTLGSNEYPREDTLAAAKALKERTDAPRHELEVSGNVVVRGDGCVDEDVYVQADNVPRSSRVRLHDAIEACEAAEPLAEYVRENVHRRHHENVEEVSGSMVEIRDHGASNIIDNQTYLDIVNDDNLTLRFTTVDDGDLIIKVHDNR